MTLIFMALLILVMSPGAGAYSTEDCIRCHKEGSEQATLQISIADFRASAHGSETTCQDCHTGILDDGHFKNKGSGEVDCNECHDQENRHGQKRTKGLNRPACYSCHTRHKILTKDNAASSVHPKQLKTTCKGCHPAETGKVGYLSWLPSVRIISHKKADFSKDYDEHNCLGCHQGQAAHGEEGPINEEGCQICHMDGRGRGALFGYMHARADIRRQPLTFAAAMIYLASILFVISRGLKASIVRAARKRKERGRPSPC